MKVVFDYFEGATVQESLLTNYFETNPNTPFDSVRRYLIDAATQYIIPYISQELYDDIANKVESKTELTLTQTKFLDHLRSANAYYAAMIYTPLRINTSTPSGNFRDTHDKTSLTAILETKFELWQITLQADKHLDLLCEFLEKQVAAGDSYFDLFKNSTAYNRGKTPFFRTTESFNRYLHIHDSRPTFIALNRAICDISEDIIAPVVCEPLFSRLVEIVEEGGGDAHEQKILHLVRRATSHLALAKAVQGLSCIIESDGVKYVSNSEGRNMQQNAVARHQNLSLQLKQNALNEGEQNLNKLKKYLSDNADEIPLYKNAPCYAALQARQSAYGAGVVTDNGMGAFVFKRR